MFVASVISIKSINLEPVACEDAASDHQFSKCASVKDTDLESKNTHQGHNNSSADFRILKKYCLSIDVTLVNFN